MGQEHVLDSIFGCQLHFEAMPRVATRARIVAAWRAKAGQMFCKLQRPGRRINNYCLRSSTEHRLQIPIFTQDVRTVCRSYTRSEFDVQPAAAAVSCNWLPAGVAQWDFWACLWQFLDILAARVFRPRAFDDSTQQSMCSPLKPPHTLH